MSVKVAINGLGRIGRCVLRAYAESPRKEFDIVAVNGPAEPDLHAHLIKYDSVHGTFKGEVAADKDSLSIGGKKMQLLREREPEKLDWKKLGVDIVLECTGKFTDKAGAEKHIAQGAKKVLISAPSADADITVVVGVNDGALKPEHRIISVGSCTTNCLAPLTKVLLDNFGIERGFMTTIHAYTGDQNIHDGSHKDMRRARAAGLSMVPTSTGAAKALGLVIPELKGKLHGVAIRVPTPNVSMVDLVIDTPKSITAEAITAAMEKAANGAMKGVLEVSKAPLVSVDFNHSSASCVYDALQTYIVGEKMARVAAWYDNEWAFSLRMLDLTAKLATAK